jgi:hypothetical protein
VTVLVRIVLWLLLTAWVALWLAACLTGLHLIAIWGWALAIAAVLAWMRCIRLLQLAAWMGAWNAWHWPLVLAVALAAPRAFLVLPGLISNYLADLRHPRSRWTNTRPAS